MVIQMTREQYNAKYGQPSPAGSSLVPESKPVQMTRAEYESKYGTVPVSRETAPRSAFGKVAEFLAPTATKTFGKLTDDVKGNVGLRDIIGSALEIGSYALPVGAIGKGVSLAVKAAKPVFGSLVKPLVTRTLQSTAVGAGAGALSEAGRAVGEGDDIGEVVSRAGKGAVGGGAVGAVIPGAATLGGKAFRTATSPFIDRAARKTEEKALLTQGAGDARIATKKLEAGKVVTDQPAKEAVRQGIPEPDVALIKTSTGADRSKMSKMLDIREKGLTDKRYAATNRSTDVVGNTFVEQIAKPIEQLNREAGKKLDVVAQRLAGKPIDPSSAVTSLADDLGGIGVTINKRTGKLNFKNSAFEGLRSVQSDIQNVWNRAVRIAKTKDALQAHRAKTFIDQIVEYGAEGQGLKGKASTILKKFRHNIDSELDTKFKTYNQVNTTFSDTIQSMQKMAEAIGKKSFRLGDKFVDANTGTAMRRIFSNTQSRSNILGMLEESQNLLKKYGVKFDEDIVSQASFADTIEKIFGSEAPTSLLGQFSKGLETFGSTGAIEGAAQLGSAGSEFMRGNLVRGTIKLGTQAAEALRGVNQENRIKALRSLLHTTRKTSAFKK